MDNPLLKNGFMVIRDALTSRQFNVAKRVSRLYIERFLGIANASGNTGYKLFRTGDLTYDFLIPRLVFIDSVWDALTAVMGDVVLVEANIHFSLPGSAVQELHRDNVEMDTVGATAKSPYLLAVHFPMTAFSLKNGATRIVPGTHLSSDDPPSIERESPSSIRRVVRLNKGDCFIRDCRAWHGAGANRSSSTRAMYSFAFAERWYRPPAKVSQDVYFNIPKKMRSCVSFDPAQFSR
jgi:Phytanoyl-CoA dioxygenase (PhyH)